MEEGELCDSEEKEEESENLGVKMERRVKLC